MRARFSEAPRWLAAAFAQSGPDDADRASGLTTFAFFLRETGETLRARAVAEEALGVARRIGDPARESLACVQLAAQLGSEEGRQLAGEAIALARRLGDPWTLSFVLLGGGEAAREAGDNERALALELEAVELARASGDRHMTAINLYNCSVMQLQQGDAVAAERGLRETVVHLRALGDPWALAYALIGLGGVAAYQGDAAGAATILGAADVRFSAMGVVVNATERAEMERYVARARALLSADAFASAWAEGSALDLKAALDYAMERVGTAG
jgi:hypothetical protein